MSKQIVEAIVNYVDTALDIADYYKNPDGYTYSPVKAKNKALEALKKAFQAEDKRG